jgi:hypothetical protein
MERETDRVHVREEDAPAASIQLIKLQSIQTSERDLSQSQQAAET